MVFFPGLDWIQSPWGLFPTVALHWLHQRVLSVLERLNMCHSCDCMHQTSQSAFSVTGICKDKKSGCFISAAASVVLFWSLHRVCLRPSISHARCCMLVSSFPSQHEQMYPYIGSQRNPHLFTITLHLMGYWWEKLGFALSAMVNLPFWLLSQSSIQSDLHPDHQHYDEQVTHTLY